MEEKRSIALAKKIVLKKHLFLKAKQGLEALFQVVAVGLLGWLVGDLLFFSLVGKLALVSGVMVTLLLLAGKNKGLFQNTLRQTLTYLDLHYPDLEDSAHLLFKNEDELSKLAKWQQYHIARLLIADPGRYSVPYSILPTVFLTTLIVLSVVFWPDATKLNFKKEAHHITHDTTRVEKLTSSLKPEVLSLKIFLRPPAYTEITQAKMESGKIETIAGSRAKWVVEFTEVVQEAVLLFNEQDSLPLSHQNGQYTGTKKLERDGVYRLLWKKDGEQYASDYFLVKLTKDHPPHIVFKGIESYVKLSWDAEPPSFTAEISDDFGLNEVRLLATVSRGSGESVKFRSSELAFDTPFKKGLKSQVLRKTLQFDALQMEPGDELYYKVIATDNRRPKPHTVSSDTYILILEDTAEQVFAQANGMGVDRMPEYFRSQRQIIIDTEKLIKTKKHLSQAEFKQKSNNLAADQKVLRLRYGQFLGEEFESAIDQGTEHAAQMAHEEEEEHEDEHGHETLEAHSGHGHEAEPEEEFTFGVGGGMLTAMMHRHDPDEVSTYFDEEIRALLKAALAQMWEAELYLRLAQPKKALPYEYKALEIIKKVQQKSRVYVARLGFDPPPLKPVEKRLTGELKEIQGTRKQDDLSLKQDFPAIRKAFSLLETGHIDQDLLEKAGEELAHEILQKEGKYWQALKYIRLLQQEKLTHTEKEKAIRIIRNAFMAVLPDAGSQAFRKWQSPDPLTEAFREQLDKEVRSW